MPVSARQRHDAPRRSARRALAAALTAGALVAACSSDPGTDATSSTPTAVTTRPKRAPVEPRPSAGCNSTTAAGPRGEQVEVELESGGGTRRYLRYEPASAPASPQPLVVDLHGYLSGAPIQVQLSAMDAVAEREGFVVATPDGTGPLVYWNAAPQRGLPDDVAFVRAIIDDIGQDLCIDRARVYVQGFSNGAFLTSLIACELADEIAAVATVAGLLVPEGCAPEVAVPVLAIHGTDDQFVSYRGGPNPALATLEWNDDTRLAFADLPFAPVEHAAATWADLDGCDPQADTRAVAPHVDVVTYDACADGADVVLYIVDGGGHTWPSSAFTELSAPVLGPTSTELDASATIWEFFDQHARAT